MLWAVSWRLGDEFSECEEADVGDAARGRESAAGEIDRPKAETLREPGHERGEGSGKCKGPSFPGLAQFPAGRAVRHESRRW